ncbi:sulfatase-like hydrolase/transferase [Paraglaciecola sp.]|uniref:sulfatase-like hydrolase/transferase n=1 Tax=Paraglaciecola sp. TaxID=1920173 RepID=UPI003EF7E242
MISHLFTFKSNVRFIFAVVLSAYLLSFFSYAEQIKRPNFVWLMSEDNSKHYLNLYDSQGAVMPNVRSLANQGLIFNNAFSNAAVCSTARSTLATGAYLPRLAMNNHRAYQSTHLPEGLKPISLLLKQAGYYTTNYSKTDYNFAEQQGIWDKSAPRATWRKRAPNQPFFHKQTFGITHESQLQFPVSDVDNVPTTHAYESINLPPIYPETDLFKYTYARTLDNHLKADKQIGEVLNQLKEDNLMDDTFIFYFGDHGGVLPASKGYLFERGLSVPLVVYIPKNFRHLVHQDMHQLKREYIDGFVSFVDFAPTLLKLAGLPEQAEQDGTAFLGQDISLKKLNERDTTFGYADRFDEKSDLVRSVREGKYKYIRHYQPFNPDSLFNAYRFKNQALKQWKNMFDAGQLNSVQASFFNSKPAEALYDIEKDPYETQNLAADKHYKNVRKKLRKKLTKQLKSLPDFGFYPESSQVAGNAMLDPTQFAQNNKGEIGKLIDIADLQLGKFSRVKRKVKAALKSEHPWQRYWGLIVMSSFKNKAKSLSSIVKSIAGKDDNLLNRARAIEYLAITNQLDAKAPLEKLVAQSQSHMQAVDMLNIATLIHDIKGTTFDIPFRDAWNSGYPSSLTEKQIKNFHYWLNNRISYLKN